MENKHAYLIMAHHHMNQLKRLIKILDYEKNDLFIHVDVKCNEFNADELLKEVEYSKIMFVPRLDVVWGDFSQIQCELQLVKYAVAENHYQYLHLISGDDFCLKSKSEIYDFFNSNYPCEFVYYDMENDALKAAGRCNEYHFLQRKTGHKKNEDSFLRNIEKKSLAIQRVLGVKRSKKIENILGKGANWFSITGDFAEYLLKQEKMIRKYFKYTVCCDEVFLHTVLNMSPYKKNLYKVPKNERPFYTNMLYTDWNRGKPYIFKTEDFSRLIKLPYMYARKFDETVDDEIITMLENHINREDF